jgi:hypothetical protein
MALLRIEIPFDLGLKGNDMAISEDVRRYTCAYPRHVTAVVSVIGDTVVIGAFTGMVPVPEISLRDIEGTVSSL